MNLKKKGGKYDRYKFLFFSKFIIGISNFNYNNLERI